MGTTTEVTLELSMVKLEWEERPGRCAVGCHGCTKPTRGRAKVRNIMTGLDEQQPWCMECALLDAFHRGAAA
ncbi:MAG: hypothetical protein M3O02_00910 [Acidobacteriota bacterium]|nr:hypothetical protein [Acidobacteriota bacterium]